MKAIKESQNRQNKNCMAYTLIDLLLALSILLIVTAIGIPSFTKIIDKNEQQKTLRELSSLLSTARQSAITYTKPAIVCPSIDKLNCTENWNNPLIVFVDNDNDKKRSDNEKLITTASIISSRANLTWRGYGSDSRVRFTPYGTAQNGTFYYCKNTGAHQLRAQLKINNTGRTRQVPKSQLSSDC